MYKYKKSGSKRKKNNKIRLIVAALVSSKVTIKKNLHFKNRSHNFANRSGINANYNWPNQINQNYNFDQH